MPRRTRLLVGLLACVSALAALRFLPSPAGEPTPTPAFELEEPQRPRGTIIGIHGGGWRRVGAREVAGERAETTRLAGYGWRVLSVDYEPGAAARRSLREWHDYARKRWDGPICAFGRSAGAHLALLLAHDRPLACVIGHGAITDLERVGGSPEADELFRRFVLPSFGAGLRRHSPVRIAAGLRIPVLLATGEGDVLAPCATQLAPFARRNRRAQIACLPAGEAPFIHGPVDRAALAAQHRRERRALLLAAAPGPPAPPPPRR